MKNRQGFVYLMLDGDGRLKIGVAANVMRRAYTLRQASPSGVEVMHKWRFGTRNLAETFERQLLELTLPFRIKGEWRSLDWVSARIMGDWLLVGYAEAAAMRDACSAWLRSRAVCEREGYTPAERKAANDAHAARMAYGPTDNPWDNLDDDLDPP